MSTPEPLTVGQVAERYGVTVRTLHHYDELGLLVPSERSAAGYRLYTDADLDRLAAVVTYRRLGFGLDDVAALLAGDGDLAAHLRRQRALISTRLGELTDLAAALDRALEDTMSHPEAPLNAADRAAVFGKGYDEAWDGEAQQRWGDTEAYRVSAARTKRYTKTDWEQIAAEGTAATTALADALRAGEPPTSERAMAGAEAHRAHIDRWFYPLDHEFHRALAEMYVADPRFTKTYEDIAPGLAAYVRAAIHANADQHAGGDG